MITGLYVHYVLKQIAYFQDKEYPVKALRISELKKEIEQLKLRNEDEQTDLCRVIENEMDKFEKKRQDVKQEITEKATKVCTII